MVATFVENFQALMTQCRELETQHHERLVEIGLHLLDKGIKDELDSVLAEELQEVLAAVDVISKRLQQLRSEFVIFVACKFVGSLTTDQSGIYYN